MLTQDYLKDLTYKINGACIEVHKILGPGLLESIYHKCLEEEFKLRNISFVSQSKISLNYKGKFLNCDFFCDFLIEDAIVLELKSVSEINDIHRAQLISYINLMKKPKGILINFNVKNLYHEGQETFVSQYFEQLK
ncbi:GxxExxY protein [Elizabethkingia miricola]|uniref:GxxExxY protein n=2 Tax=Elizabethkingia TaxID=308865 RepID=A0ABD5B8J1_ELIMR|nr:GxxExxY protein [Elizabethkingia miricola]MDQ8750219.1 GxxExxY protein [Elizabethkingia miricola]PSL87912.1 GxxExxY protein [Elizabethkingia miricola]QHQ88146.1 GxxExxY protein [Elizabethkingia miricola]UIO95683.1 GxxExxY protein [Elizabethkingia miricola]WER12472.1 GxxExxY protein [Elizabethkingia miricola]